MLSISKRISMSIAMGLSVAALAAMSVGCKDKATSTQTPDSAMKPTPSAPVAAPVAAASADTVAAAPAPAARREGRRGCRQGSGR